MEENGKIFYRTFLLRKPEELRKKGEPEVYKIAFILFDKTKELVALNQIGDCLAWNVPEEFDEIKNILTKGKEETEIEVMERLCSAIGTERVPRKVPVEEQEEIAEIMSEKLTETLENLVENFTGANEKIKQPYPDYIEGYG